MASMSPHKARFASPGKVSLVAMSPAKSPVSPFLRPSKRFSDFLMAKKKKRLLFQSPSKKKAKSPLKMFKNSNSSPLKSKSPNLKSKLSATKSPKRKSRTPVKIPIDTYFKRGGNSVTKSPMAKNCRSLPDGSKSPIKNGLSPKATKRQLQFGSKNSPATTSKKMSPSIRSLDTVVIDEEANLESPLVKKKQKISRLSSEAMDTSATESKVSMGVEKLPIDWSLKTRIRFVSQESFPFRGNFRTCEESTGITSFVRCLHPVTDPDHSTDSGIVIVNDTSNSNCNPSLYNCNSHSQFDTLPNCSSNQPFSPNTIKRKKAQLDTSLSAVLRQHTLVWMHPHLPWLSLFPRIDIKTPTLKGVTLQIDPSSSIADSLMNDWITSLRSLYHLIKTRQAPYFYICAHSMTILIRASGIAGIDEIQVLITPTTSGFRNGLKREGINYILPFMGKKYDASTGAESQINESSSSGRNSANSFLIDDSSRASTISNADKENELNVMNHKKDTDSNEDEDEDGEHSSFLESIGLSQQDFPSLSNRPKSSRAGHLSKRSDNNLSAKAIKKQSLVLVSGPDVQLFINYLSNDPKLISTTSGPLAAVPATLLAPVSFTGATLTPLKLKLNASTYQEKKFFSLDIVGPILPSAVLNLADFFKSTQEGNFKMNLINCESTSPFASFDSLGKDWTRECAFDRKWFPSSQPLPGSSTGVSCGQGTSSSQGAPETFASAFATESLKDCGLSSDLIQGFCSRTASSKEALTEVTLKDNLYIVN